MPKIKKPTTKKSRTMVHAVRGKKKAVKPKKVEKPEEPAVRPQPERYFEAVGRRKTAVARVRFFTKGNKEFLVNDKPLNNYFPASELQQIAVSALNKMNCLDKFKVSVKVKGGGLHAQAEATRHGISRALVKFNSGYRKMLKKAGFLTRDSRMRERKKFGLKRARRAPQWSKR